MKAVPFVLFILCAYHMNAQVNAYAKVTSISSTVLNLTSANETYGTFTAGSQVIVMQMQDDVIGANTSDNSSFGNLATIASAGDYELTTIASVSRSSGTLTQVTINSPLAKVFNTSSNSSVQIISYPQLGSGNYTTTADIEAVSWNGSIGGVVAFKVNGALTLNHNVSADNAGFRGGTVNSGTSGSCDATSYRGAAGELIANKGEGIYRATNSSYVAGRGKIINGGGGGNSHNGGGGGGSNYSSGGEGGRGYGCSASSGGIGGVALNLFTSTDKAFLGGGGGAGEANNSYNTAGGAGGGIIIINANSINTSGSGASLRISANGGYAANVGNDGAGGGGAGGSVLLVVQSWNIAATKTLSISANGGGGGSVTDATPHGGGGGGGQGAVIFSSAVPTVNVSATTAPGAGGNNSSGGTFAGNGGGTANQGVFNGSFALLATIFKSFIASADPGVISFKWNMVNQQNVSYFHLEASDDNSSFRHIHTIYNENRDLPAYEYRLNIHTEKISRYYRIKAVVDERIELFSHVINVPAMHSSNVKVTVQPNPARETATLLVRSEKSSVIKVEVLNVFGAILQTRFVHINKGENRISMWDIVRLKAGNYHIRVTHGDQMTSTKMMVLK